MINRMESGDNMSKAKFLILLIQQISCYPVSLLGLQPSSVCSVVRPILLFSRLRPGRAGCILGLEMTTESVLTKISNPTNTREALVAAAIRLFARKWFAVVSVAEICREAGVSNGLFYRYFRGKEEIFRLILESVLKSIGGLLAGVRGDSVEERIRSFVRSVADYSTEHRDRKSGV